MMINVVKIDWADVNKAVPAFLTIAIMPFTYSIAYGEAFGLVFITLRPALLASDGSLAK